MKTKSLFDSLDDELKSIKNQLLTFNASSIKINQDSNHITTPITTQQLCEAIVNVCDICRLNNTIYMYDPVLKLYVKPEKRLSTIVSLLSRPQVQKSKSQLNVTIKISNFKSFVQNAVFNLESLASVLDEPLVRKCHELPTEWILTKDNKAINFKTKEIRDESELLNEYDPFYRSNRRLIVIDELNEIEKTKFLVNNTILNKVLDDWSDKSEENLKFLMQMSFAIVTCDNKEKFIIIMGGGGNGKTSFIELNKQLVGQSSVVNMNLHQWSDSNTLNQIGPQTRFISGDDATKKRMYQVLRCQI